MKRYAIAMAMLAAVTMATGAQAATLVEWTSGVSGFWDTDAEWSVSGGAATTATLAFGDSDGWDSGELILDADIRIAGDGIPGSTDVLYDADFEGGDFKLNSGPGGTGALTISNGASLELRSTSTPDGKWTEIDAALIRVTGAGSVMSRTHTDPAKNAGAFVFGSWRNDPGEVMDLEVLDGGTFDNQGQMWFGAWGDSAADLDLTWTVGGFSSIKNRDYLGGGVSLDQPGDHPDAEINFIYNWDDATGALDDSDYAIDITGHGGSVAVGKAGEANGGIWYQNSDASGNANHTGVEKTYEDLWADGTLQADGASAGAFGDHFAVTGTSGGVGVYRVVSIEDGGIGGAFAGDISGDGLVNAIDAGPLFANFGLVGGTLAQGNIDPSGIDEINAVDAGTMFANWTGDPGPSGPGNAVAEYDYATGEIIVSMDGVNNWFVRSASFGLTADNPSHTPIVPGSLASDNNEIIGETGFSPGTGTDVSLGFVAEVGLPLGDLTLSFVAGLGTPEVTVDVVYVNVPPVPEPTTLVLAAFGLCGVLATRRRRVA